MSKGGILKFIRIFGVLSISLLFISTTTAVQINSSIYFNEKIEFKNKINIIKNYFKIVKNVSKIIETSIFILSLIISSFLIKFSVTMFKLTYFFYLIIYIQNVVDTLTDDIQGNLNDMIASINSFFRVIFWYSSFSYGLNFLITLFIFYFANHEYSLIEAWYESQIICMELIRFILIGPID